MLIEVSALPLSNVIQFKLPEMNEYLVVFNNRSVKTEYTLYPFTKQ